VFVLGAFGAAGVGAGCSTAGSTWMEEPLSPIDQADPTTAVAPAPELDQASHPTPNAVRARTIGGDVPSDQGDGDAPNDQSMDAATGGASVAGGRSLGTFRNTYYDFPSEADYDGPTVSLPSRSCGTIASVPRDFFEALCVQGSGTLRRGSTVSFAKRDCDCAPVCTKTGQKICFDELDGREFPWGRGATGKAIIPLLTVAVDPAVIPLGTAIYVPELDGLPRDPDGTAAHDGCFVAQDKGLSVSGQHIDIFTGHRSITTLWNRRVPSNRGVTVVVDSPRCARVVP
jgi:3D (Asp-Asp-Asp) domain-containing protein